MGQPFPLVCSHKFLLGPVAAIGTRECRLRRSCSFWYLLGRCLCDQPIDDVIATATAILRVLAMTHIHGDPATFEELWATGLRDEDDFF
jgi:hypothetical protein